MCGRLAQAQELQQFIYEFLAQPGTPAPANVPAGADTRPTNRLVVIARGKDGARKMIFPHWGMIDQSGEKIPNTINARAEFVGRSRLWRPLFEKGRRCLIPFDAFYEWQKVPDPDAPQTKSKVQRVPYTITVRSNRAFAFAGLYSTWRPRLTEDEAESVQAAPIDLCATIITTKPNAKIEPLHDRMPAILTAEHFAAWLGETECPTHDLLAMLGPLPEQMTEVKRGGPFG
jgi:Uncharacterized conserved protein